MLDNINTESVVKKLTPHPIRKQPKECRGKKANNLNKQKQVLENNYTDRRARLAALEQKWKNDKKSMTVDEKIEKD